MRVQDDLMDAAEVKDMLDVAGHVKVGAKAGWLSVCVSGWLARLV